MSKSAELASLIQARAGAEAPEYGLILGSGLGHLSQAVDGVAIPYDDLPGFPHAGVSGHVPQLVIGQLEGARVAVFGGRSHYYESGRPDAMRLPLETLAALGTKKLILTNAAGAVNTILAPGGLMMLNDHIAFAGANPLIGEKTDARFVPLTDAHDVELRAALRAAADAEGVVLPEGVYGWFSGPSFETPAEIRAARVLGMDAVGMSTVPEVIAARYLGLEVLGISCITNMATGIATVKHAHAEVVKIANAASERFCAVVAATIEQLGAP